MSPTDASPARRVRCGVAVATVDGMRRLAGEWRGAPRGTCELGGIPVDRVGFDEAQSAIQALVESRHGGTVFTPNVDHVMLAQEHARFREAYRAASLRLADGTPLVWASRLLHRALPAKVSGSDLIWPLMKRAGARGWRVYLLGGDPGVAAAAAKRFQDELGVQIVGIDDAFIRDPDDAAERAPVTARLREARPELVLLALGAPKQELLAQALRRELPSAVFMGVGASLDFIAGTRRRAPRWMSAAGLEWAFRLAQEPARLWRRYLIRDPKFFALVLRELHTAQVRAFATSRAARALSPGRVDRR